MKPSPFRLRVWAEVKKIPKGQTATYSQIAQRIGKPKAVRAVASAVAANTDKIIIPCHRVILSSGKPGKYRWGTREKIRLLRNEGVNI